jgi:hypothetical protein
MRTRILDLLRRIGDGIFSLPNKQKAVWLAASAALSLSQPASAQSRVPYCIHKCDAQCSVSNPGSYKAGCVNSCVARCVQDADSSDSRFGAVYVSGSARPSYGYSFAWRRPYDAMDEAAGQCRSRSGGQPCQRLLVFENKCASVVFVRRGDNNVVDIAGGAEPNQAAASAAALALCRSENPGAQCTVEKEFCSDDTP